MVDAVGQAHFAQQVRGALPLLVLGEVLPGVGQGHHDVLQRGHARQQVEALEDEADDPVAQPGPLLGAELGDLLAVEPVLARGGVVQAAQDVHQRALAGATGAHERHQLAPGDVSEIPLSTGRSHLAQVVGLVNVLQFNQIHDLSTLRYRPRAAPGLSGPGMPCLALLLSAAHGSGA